MKTEIRTNIEIDAPAEAVWEVLADTGAYPEWNPFMQSFEGDLVEGGHGTLAATERGFAEMNEALKRRVEDRAAAV